MMEKNKIKNHSSVREVTNHVTVICLDHLIDKLCTRDKPIKLQNLYYFNPIKNRIQSSFTQLQKGLNWNIFEVRFAIMMDSYNKTSAFDWWYSMMYRVS